MDRITSKSGQSDASQPGRYSRAKVIVILLGLFSLAAAWLLSAYVWPGSVSLWWGLAALASAVAVAAGVTLSRGKRRPCWKPGIQVSALGLTIMVIGYLCVG